MNDIIKSLRSSYAIKSIKLSSKSIETLSRQIFNVIFKYRDAYLVDCCAISIEYASLFLKELCELLNIHYSFVKVIELGYEDNYHIIFANTSILEAKLISISKCYPIIIDINSKEPFIVSDSRRFILESFYSLITCYLKLSESSMMKIIDNGNIVGYPFIAGWLIGYPVLYLSKSVEGNALQEIQSLQKYSLLGTIDGVEIDLMEFTIPHHILINNLQLSSIINSYLNNKIEETRTITSIISCRDLHIETNTYTVTSVVL